MTAQKKTSIKRVLVAYKQTAKTGRTPLANGVRAHLRTLDQLYHTLQDRGIPFRALPINQLRAISSADLIITVGGDGTVLATSHYVKDQPILGVKSFGQTSVGHFCAVTASTLPRYLDAILAGQRRPLLLNRLEVRVDGHRLQEFVLNDCLFAHGSPAALTEYRLSVGRASEVQRSSGVWISTAAGSTAAMRGAGGKDLPLESQRLQYRVREPYCVRKPYRLHGAILPATAIIRLESFVSNGTLSIDGAHIQYPIPVGTKISVRCAKSPLKIYWR